MDTLDPALRSQNPTVLWADFVSLSSKMGPIPLLEDFLLPPDTHLGIRLPEVDPLLCGVVLSYICPKFTQVNLKKFTKKIW